MIHFEITKSPDLNVKTSFKFHKNEIYMGRKSGDLHIQDHLLNASHLLLEIPETDLLIHPQPDVTFFLLNGKRCTTIRKLRVGDKITFGETTLVILDFKPTQYPSKKDILNNKLSKLIEEGSPRLPVIETISKMMK
jgi:hypothetical protein